MDVYNPYANMTNQNNQFITNSQNMNNVNMSTNKAISKSSNNPIADLFG